MNRLIIPVVILFIILFHSMYCYGEWDIYNYSFHSKKHDTDISTGKIAEQYYTKAVEFQKQKNYRAAVGILEKVIVLNPNLAKAYNDLGVTNENLLELKKAEKNYRKALEVNSNYLPAYTNLALLLESQGRYNQAVPYWIERARLGDPYDPWTIKAKRRLEILGSLFPELQKRLLKDKAFVLQKKLVKEFEQTMDTVTKNMVIGRKHFFEKEYDLALEAFNNVLILDPDHKEALEFIKKTKFLKNKKQILAVAQKAMSDAEQGDFLSATEGFTESLSILSQMPLKSSLSEPRER